LAIEIQHSQRVAQSNEVERIGEVRKRLRDVTQVAAPTERVQQRNEAGGKRRLGGERTEAPRK